MKSFLKHCRYLSEAFLIVFFLVIFKLLPWKLASFLGGSIGRRLIYLAGIKRRVLLNLRYVFPDKSPQEYKNFLTGVGNNIGRTIAETVHLKRMLKQGGIHVFGAEHLEKAYKQGRGAICFAAHMGNWEICPLMAEQYNIPLLVVYRTPNNPYSAWILNRFRDAVGDQRLPKGNKAAGVMLKALKKGNVLGILIDQKQNNGAKLDFLGKPAMTTTISAGLALKTGAVLLPCETYRDEKQRPCVRVHPPLVPLKDETATALTQRMTDHLSQFVLKHPEQWLWMHRRWGKL